MSNRCCDDRDTPVVSRVAKRTESRPELRGRRALLFDPFEREIIVPNCEKNKRNERSSGGILFRKQLRTIRVRRMFGIF